MAEHPRRQRCRRNGRLRVRVPLCPPSRLHAQSHGLITRVKPYVSEKTWVFPPLHPSFIGFSALFCGPMAYNKAKQVYTATSRRPMFSTQNGQGCQVWETGHLKSTVSRVRLPSHPLGYASLCGSGCIGGYTGERHNTCSASGSTMEYSRPPYTSATGDVYHPHLRVVCCQRNGRHYEGR